MLMVSPLLTVRDFRIGLSYEVADEGELLGNYAFNISQGILQHVSRFIDALTFVEEDAESGRGGVMGFGHKRNVLNLVEKAPARRVAWDQQEKERIQKKAVAEAAAAKEAAEAAALKAAEQDAKVAALEAKVAEMQALAALCGSAPVPGPPRPSAPIAPPHIPAPSAFIHLMHPPHVDNNRICGSTTCRSSSAGASCVEMVQACNTGAPEHELACGLPQPSLTYERRQSEGKTGRGEGGGCHCLAVRKFKLRAPVVEWQRRLGKGRRARERCTHVSHTCAAMPTAIKYLALCCAAKLDRHRQAGPFTVFP